MNNILPLIKVSVNKEISHARITPTTFEYNYMVKAIWVSALVGAVCAFYLLTLFLKVGH